MAAFDLESYAAVQERIAQFYQDFPDGSIRSFLILRDGPEVIFEARVYRTPEEAAQGVYTSGFAREIEGKSPVNKTSHLENCETSAVGRALANLGYASDARRPSRNEMIKVARVKAEHEQMLEYIRSAGQQLGDQAVFAISGEEMDAREYIRKNWAAIKEQYRVARSVVDMLEAATGVAFGERAAA